MAQQSLDERAFERGLIELIPQLRAFARMLEHNAAQADDLAQECLAKAWAAQANFTPGTNLKAWAFMILRNQFYSEKRRAWRSCQLDPEVAEQTLTEPVSQTSTLELDELRRAMSMLCEEHREALVLVGAAGLSYEEAADIMGVPVGTVKSRVCRARRRILEIYANGSITTDDVRPSAALASILSQIDSYRRLAA